MAKKRNIRSAAGFGDDKIEGFIMVPNELVAKGALLNYGMNR